MQNSVAFSREQEGETHHFYLKMRDISGMEATETRCHVALTVARLSFIRKFLLIDDLRGAPTACRSGTVPTDAQADAYLRRIMSATADFLPPGETPGTFNVFGEGDTEFEPKIPDAFLDTLGVYQNVIWDCGHSLKTGLFNDLTQTKREHVARYRGAGGNLLFMIYRGPVTVITGVYPNNADAEKCPYTGLSTSELWTRFSFLWQAFHLRGCVDKPRPRPDAAAYDRNSMVAARAENGLYQDLTLNWAAYTADGCSGGSLRGVREYECLWPGTADPDETPWFETEDGLQILYRGETYRRGQRLDGLPVAWRTFATREDSLQGITPGRTVVFAFHPYYFNESGVQQAMTLALEWLVTGSEF
jgi:hypothetical protein